MTKERAGEIFEKRVLALRACHDELGHLIHGNDEAQAQLDKARTLLFDLVGAAEDMAKEVKGWRTGPERKWR